MHAGLARLAALARAEPLSPDCNHFYFLRHGQTGRNAQRIFQDRDEPLSALGLTQAARAAERLAGEPIASIACSDMKRAFDTAHAVSAACGIAPCAIEGLHERDFGALIGTSSAELDWNCEPKRGETLPVFVQRKRAALARALALPAPVLVVAHGGSLYVLAALLGVPIDRRVLGNAQPLRFFRANGTWQVQALSDAGDAIAALA